MTLLLGISALVLDVGRVYYVYAHMKKATDAAALAGAQRLPDANSAYIKALEYAQRNGLSPFETDITVPFQNWQRIRVACHRSVPFLLAPVLGLNGKELTVYSVAEYGGDRVFDYALFSGSSTQMLQSSGANLRVVGDVHANNDIKFSGCNLDIQGSLEAVGCISTPGCNKCVQEEIPNAPFIPSPQWSMQDLKNQATNILYGDQHLSGNLTLDGIMFVEGDVHLDGCNISGTGSIVATGDIRINGANILYTTSTDALCLYAGRSIKISGANTRIDGILYAPNLEIQLSGANIYVKGAVIADIVKMSSSNINIEHDANAIRAVPVKTARLVE